MMFTQKCNQNHKFSLAGDLWLFDIMKMERAENRMLQCKLKPLTTSDNHIPWCLITFLHNFPLHLITYLYVNHVGISAFLLNTEEIQLLSLLGVIVIFTTEQD